MRHNTIEGRQDHWAVAKNASKDEVLVQLHNHPDQARVSLPLDHAKAMVAELQRVIATIEASDPELPPG